MSKFYFFGFFRYSSGFGKLGFYLLALAMGFSPDELGLKFHRTRLSGILEKLGI